MILKLDLSNDIEHSHNMANMYRVPVLKDQGVDGCLSVWLRWHPLAHVVHERLDNRVILVSHLQCICFSQPTRNEKETSALQENNQRPGGSLAWSEVFPTVFSSRAAWILLQIPFVLVPKGMDCKMTLKVCMSPFPQ